MIWLQGWITCVMAAAAGDAQLPRLLHARLVELAPHLAHRAPVPGEAVITSALSGQVVSSLQTQGTPSGTISVTAVADLPVAQLWKAAVDDDHQGAFLGVDESVVVGGTARQDGYLSYQYVDVFGPFDRWWVTRTHFNAGLYGHSGSAAWEAWFEDQHRNAEVMAALPPRLTRRASPLQSVRGSWLFLRVDQGRTLIQYTVHSAPGGVPAAVAARLSTGATRDAVRDIIHMARVHSPGCTAAYRAPDGVPL